MTSAFPKLLTAAAAATFLALSPVSAEVTGGPEVVPRQDLDARVSPYKHEIREGFEGAQIPPAYADVEFDPQIGDVVPEDVDTVPVPDSVVQATPDVAGYEYFTLPDGSVVLVHPDDRTIATVID